MPICHRTKLHRITQKAFSEIDYEVMGTAFAAHNEMGRLFDEIHYADYMEARLIALGHQVNREYNISVIYQDFKKDYYIDLLVDSSVPYELKTVKDLNDEHRAQALNYLCLCDLSHGKLINFRKPSVEGEFISTSLAHTDRTQYIIDKCEWNEISTHPILPVLEGLLDDWGTYLSLEIYREAISHFCCSKNPLHASVTLQAQTGPAGKLSLNRIHEDSFLYVTSTNKYLSDHRKHLLKVLEMTDQKQAQWINFDGNRVTMRSVVS